MSGSKRKKELKDLEHETQGQRARAEAAEAKKEKNKTVIYSVIFGICAVAALVLILWNNGVFSSQPVVATVNGHDYTAAEVEYFYSNARQMMQMYASYGMSNYDSTMDDNDQIFQEAAEAVLDDNGEVVTEAVEEKTYRQYFEESAVDSLTYYTIWSDAAKAANYQLPAEGKKEIDDQFDEIDLVCRQNGISMASYFNQVFGNGMTKKLYRNLQEFIGIATYYQQEYTNNQGATNEEIEAYYQENAASYDKVDYNLLTISGVAASTTNAAGETVEPTEAESMLAMAAAKTSADAVADEVQGGKDFYSAAVQVDTTEAAKTDKDYYLHEAESLSSANSAIREWLSNESRKAGDVTVVANSSNNGYMVVQFLDLYRDETPTANVRHILIKAETTEYYTDENGSEVVYVAPENPAEDYEKPTTTSKPSEEQWAAAKAEIERIEQEWITAGGTEDAFIQMINKYTDDVDADGKPNSDGTSEGLYENVYSGRMVPNFNDWVFADGRQPGDHGIVDNDGSYFGYHLIYYVSSGEPKYVNDIRSTIRSEKATEWYDAQKEVAVTEVNDEEMAKIG